MNGNVISLENGTKVSRKFKKGNVVIPKAISKKETRSKGKEEIPPKKEEEKKEEKKEEVKANVKNSGQKQEEPKKVATPKTKQVKPKSSGKTK